MARVSRVTGRSLDQLAAEVRGLSLPHAKWDVLSGSKWVEAHRPNCPTCNAKAALAELVARARTAEAERDKALVRYEIDNLAIGAQRKRAEADEARIVRLEAALREIEEWDYGWPAGEARRALAEVSGPPEQAA